MMTEEEIRAALAEARDKPSSGDWDQDLMHSGFIAGLMEVLGEEYDGS